MCVGTGGAATGPPKHHHPPMESSLLLQPGAEQQLQRQQQQQRMQWPQSDHAYVMLSDGRPRPMTMYTVSLSQEPSLAEFSILNPRGLAAFADLLPK